jgi:ribonuclease HII
MRKIGADEAGRGPVLGPMVAAAVLADPEAPPRKVADSKTLTPGKRETLAATMDAEERIATGLSVVTPDRIDDSAVDVNSLTVAAQAEAITRALNLDTDGGTDGPPDDGVADESSEVARQRAVVDACDVDPERFARRVREALPIALDLRAEHRAEETHAVVAAASVLAKVERDSLLTALDAQYEKYGPVGSGYPSDPRTREFLRTYVREHEQLPACARASWKTSRDVLNAAEQSALGEF